MIKRIRLKPEERKAEILKKAIELFNQKGYKDTTMADLVEASGLSFGGFYHYYSDKADILMDIMRAGNKYRFEQSRKFMEENPDLHPTDMIVALGVNKLLDKNDMKSIYAMLLLEIKNDEKLRALYAELVEEGIRDFQSFLKETDLAVFANVKAEFLIGVINCLFLGMYTLDLQDVFERDKEMLGEMIKLMLRHHRA